MLFKKRASLALSVNAIVVIVIAFVVLGLGLTLTRTIFSGAQDIVPGALSLTDLDKQPDAGNPITLSAARIKLKLGGTNSINAGFYNTETEEAEDAVFEIEKCLSVDTGEATDYVPEIRNLEQDVGASKSAAYNLVFYNDGDEGLTSGLYICNLLVVDKTGDEFAKKQINIEITA